MAHVNELRRQSRSKANDFEALKSQYDALTAEHFKVSQRSKSDEDLYERRLKEVEEERDSLRQWQRRAQSLAIELEEERRRAAEGARIKEDQAASRKGEEAVQSGSGDETLRNELRSMCQLELTNTQDNLETLSTCRTITMPSSLRCTNCARPRKRRRQMSIMRGRRSVCCATKSELSMSNWSVLGTRWSELKAWMVADASSLTQTFPASSSDDAATLQNRLSTLSTLHTETKATLSDKTKEVDELHRRLTKLATDSTSATLEATRRAEEAERELRWAKEGRRSAEARESLARKELETRGGGSGGGDAQQLQGLVDQYKRELEAMSRDSRDVETRLELGAGLVKATELEAAQERASQLEKGGLLSYLLTEDIEELQETITQLNAANTTLDAEVSELMRRVASGEYNPAKERCVELLANPAAKVRAIRQAQLDDLLAENTALLERMATLDQPGASGVPRESYDRLEKEKNEQQAAHEKRLLRLKEVRQRCDLADIRSSA